MNVGEPQIETFDFFKAPYDVRRAIYQVFYPLNTTLQLTYGHPAWEALNPHGAAAVYTMAAEGKHFLRTCSKVRNEISEILYGTNTFLLAPGAINFHKILRFPHSNSELFVPNLQVSTRQTLREPASLPWSDPSPEVH